METKQAQDELVKFMLAPMQHEIDKVKAENKAAQEEAQIVEEKIKTGLCIASHGFYCNCKECESHSKAYDIVDDKPKEILAVAALVEGGFSKEEARYHVDIFDELGIFTEFELFCRNKSS